MKMNMKKYFFLLVAAVMTLTACEDWLDKTPQSQLTPDTFFKTEGELQLFANQFYSSAFGTTVFNAMQTDTHIQDQPSSELRGGNNRSVTATSSYWNFSLIRKCYILIGYADNCPDEAAREKYKAIAKFFIVQDYYDKVRRFGDVPWYDKELETTSEELYKYVLDGEAVGAFAGKVFVAHDAQKTTSQMTNQNLCATKTARMFTQPMLEIYADDVKCAHGSTVGQLNDTALFYMQQRGISVKEAKLLLEFAFINEVVDKMELIPLRDRLHYLVEQRFRGQLSKCEGCRLCH